MKEYNNKINNNKEIYNKIMSYDTDGVLFWNVKIYEEVFIEKSIWSNHSIVFTTMLVIWIILWNGFNVGK